MSTKLGTLTLDLIAKIGNFIEPVKKAEKQTKLSFDNMRKHVNTYGTMAVAGAAAVGAGVLAMANEYANAARELQTFASISNATTQEFQKMAVGAETMGISSEKLADQLKDFNEKLGEFITIGSGGAVDFFEQIAIKTEGSAEAARKLALEMQNLSGPQALQLYVDKLEEAGVTQQQMSFYLESMASDTTNLIPLLKNGGEGFKFWADAAERAGVIMDEYAIEKANELRVQMDLLNLQVQGAKNQFIQGLMPALVSVGNAMTNTTDDTNMLSDAGEALGNVFKGVAAVGMGVYATIKMLSNAIAGLAHDAVAANNTINAGSEKGSWADKLPGIKFAKKLVLGTTLARAPNSGVSMAAQDNAKIAEDTADMINGLFSDTVSKATAAMAKTQAGQAGVIKGSDEWIKKQNEAAKATRENTKALRDQNRALEDARRLIYEYGSEFNRIETDLSEEINRIAGSSLKSASKNRMIEDAKEIAEARKKLYAAELDYDLNQYQMTEREKLKAQLNIDKLSIDATKGLLDAERKLKKDALDAQSKIEQTAVRISQDKALLEIKRNWMTAGDYAREYYALVREEILNTASYSPEMKEALLQQAVSQQNFEQSSERDQAISDYRDVMGYEESPLVKQFEVLDKMRELDLISEEKYQQDKLMLQTKYSASYMQSMLGGFMSLVDENSSAYAAMFAAQKAFAVAQALINIPATYSNTVNAVSAIPLIGPYIAPAMGAAAAALQVAQAASIKSVGLTGMAHDGINNIPEEGTWLLNKGERVLNPSQNRDLTNYLSQVQTGGQNRPIDNKLSVIMVKDEDEAKNYKYSKDFEDAVLYHMKRNRSKI